MTPTGTRDSQSYWPASGRSPAVQWKGLKKAHAGDASDSR